MLEKLHSMFAATRYARLTMRDSLVEPPFNPRLNVCRRSELRPRIFSSFPERLHPSVLALIWGSLSSFQNRTRRSGIAVQDSRFLTFCKFLRIPSALSQDNPGCCGLQTNVLPSITRSRFFGWHRALDVLGIGACNAARHSGQA
jgi:hypothetical protein